MVSLLYAYQARGLDIIPQTISRFRAGGDNETADILAEVIYPEEVTHCAAGVKWFKYLCERDFVMDNRAEQTQPSGLIDFVIPQFHKVVRQHFKGRLKPPFNEEARLRAGFGPEWYLPLSIVDQEESLEK